MKSFFTPRLAFLVAIALIIAASYAFGYTTTTTDLAGLSLLPFALGTTVGMEDIAKMVKQQGDDLDAWKKKQESTVSSLEADVMEMAKKSNRPKLDGKGDDTDKGEKWFDTKTRSPVLVLKHGQPMFTGEKAAPSVGRALRGILLGGRADDANELADERKAMGIGNDPSGGFTVAGGLAAEWIDLLRSQMVLSQAGARTVPMGSGTLSLAKVTGDPVVSWHGENAQISEATPTLGQLTLTAKTVVCLVKLSLELSQDSANIEQMVSSTLINAMASAIDTAGLVGVTTNAAAAPAGVISLSGRNKVTSIGAPTNWDYLVDGCYELMADNVSLENIGAFIAHPAVWKKMRKLKSGIASDNTPLQAPDEVAKMRKFWTTAAPLTGGTTATGVIADWRDLLFGVRQNIEVKVLQETLMGSNLQIALLAYARVDFGATRHQSFCTLEGITV